MDVIYLISSLNLDPFLPVFDTQPFVDMYSEFIRLVEDPADQNRFVQTSFQSSLRLLLVLSKTVVAKRLVKTGLISGLVVHFDRVTSVEDRVALAEATGHLIIQSDPSFVVETLKPAKQRQLLQVMESFTPPQPHLFLALVHLVINYPKFIPQYFVSTLLKQTPLITPPVNNTIKQIYTQFPNYKPIVEESTEKLMQIFALVTNNNFTPSCREQILSSVVFHRLDNTQATKAITDLLDIIRNPSSSHEIRHLVWNSVSEWVVGSRTAFCEFVVNARVPPCLDILVREPVCEYERDIALQVMELVSKDIGEFPERSIHII